MALCWLVLWPPRALAHARLVRSDPPDLCLSPQLSGLRPFPGELPCATGAVLPQPPPVVRLIFNERVDLVGRGVKILAPDGRRAEAWPARVAGSEVSVDVHATEPGTYLVIWRVVAADTHPAQGTFAFSVGHPSPPPGGAAGLAGGPAGTAVGLVLQMLARALHFTGYGLSFGVLAFRNFLLAPLALTAEPRVERRVWRLIGAGVLALLIAEPLALVAQTTSLSAGGGGPFDLDLVGGVLDSSFGRVLAQRLGAAVLLWVLVGAASNAHIGAGQAAWAVSALGAAVALIDGEAAHAVGVRPAWLALGLNTVHEGAMGLWVGTLFGLLAVWRLPGVVSCRGELVTGVSRAAAASVALLAVTGAGMALQHLTGLSDLAASAYGRTLAAKIVALGIVLSLATAAARAPLDRRARWWQREAAVLVGALALAGLLVSVAPPR